MTPDNNTELITYLAARAGGELLVPGFNLLLERRVQTGAIHFLAGVAARSILGLPGWLLVGADSFSVSLTGEGLLSHAGRAFTGSRTQDNDPSDSPTLCSAVPGRERWRVHQLEGNERLARKIETFVGNQPGVREVKASSVTGRVAVLFDPEIVTDVAALLRESLAGEDDEPAGKAASGAGYGQIVNLVRSVQKDTSAPWRAARLSVLNNWAALVSPMCLSAMMNAAVSGGSPLLESLGIANPLLQMGMFSGGFLGLKAGESWTEYESKVAWQRYATDVEHALRLKVFAHIEWLDMAEVEARNTSQLMSLVHSDTAAIRRFLETVPGTAIDKVGTMLIASAFLLWVSPISFFLALLPVPFVVLLFRRFHEQISEQYRAQGMREAATHNLVMNSLTGLSTIKSFTAEAYELKRLEGFSDRSRVASDESYALSLKYGGLTKYAIVTGLVLPMAYGATMVLRGSLSIGTFMLQSFMLPKLIQTMGGLDREYDLYQSAIAASNRLQKLLETQPTIRPGENPVGVGLRGEVRFEDVSFRYPSSGDILRDFRLDVQADTTIAIVGATGSGKSTLVKLLLRFYDIQQGRILLDGQDIRDLNFHDLRSVIGVVSQDVFLFDGSVYENIEYGRPGATREEVVEAARVAEALDFIEKLPAGFNTLVGERGLKLSGGERQRISIARVLLKNPRIMILDEATSSVDNETESAIRGSLTSIARGRTIIFIAHRLSSIRHVDQIHVMERGRIHDRGTHDELLRRNGLYASLWKLQTGEPESERHVNGRA
jgi:ATP-binding cassette, subfamily B, bacterial